MLRLHQHPGHYQVLSCTECQSPITDEREQRCPWCCEPMCRNCWTSRYAGQCSLCEVEHGSPQAKSKVTQTLTSEQWKDLLSILSPPVSGADVGVEGKRSSTEHAVSAANPRRGMMSRAPEACPTE